MLKIFALRKIYAEKYFYRTGSDGTERTPETMS